MAAKVGSIFIGLDANLGGLVGKLFQGEKAIGNFANRSNRHLGALQSRLTMFQRVTVDKLGGRGLLGALGGASGLGALAGGFGLAAIVQQAQAATKSFADLNDAIRASGVSSDLFQGLEFGGIEEGVTGISKALEDFASKSGLAVVGKGRMIEALKALNPELLRNIQLAKDQDERIRLVADAVARASSAEEKAAIVKATFGDSMLGLVRVFENGARGLDDFTRRARELGLVIDRSILAKADEMDDKLSVAAKVVDVNLKSAFIEVAPHIVTAARALAGLSRELNYFLSAFKNVEDRSTEQLKRRLESLRELRTNPLGRLATFAGNSLSGTPGPTNMDELHAEIERVKKELERRAQRPEITVTPGPRQTSTSTDRSEAAELVEDQRKAVSALVEDLKFESEQLQRNAQDQELYNALKSVGVERSSAFGQQIESTLGPLQRQRAEIEKIAVASNLLGETMGDALSSIFVHGEKAIDVARRLSLRLADAAIQALAFKAASGIVGALFGSPVAMTGAAATGVGAFPYHTGARGPLRSMSFGSHFSAPRLHEGLAPREFKAILEQGESVLTRDMTSRTAETIKGLASLAGAQTSGVTIGKIEVNVEGGKDPEETGRRAGRAAADELIALMDSRIMNANRPGGINNR